MQCSKKTLIIIFVEEFEKDSHAPRGNRPVFECYWNGRLIPYTYTGAMCNFERYSNCKNWEL